MRVKASTLSLVATILGWLPTAIRGLESPLILKGIIDVVLGPNEQLMAVTVHTSSDIDDLSVYSLRVANSAKGVTFPAVRLQAGEFYTVAESSSTYITFFGTAPDATSSDLYLDGNDSIELIRNGKEVVDIFGVHGQDGDGQPWEYTDGWAYRHVGTGADGNVFEPSNWILSGPGAMHGETNNADAAVPFPRASYRTALTDVDRVLVEEDASVTESFIIGSLLPSDMPSSAPAATMSTMPSAKPTGSTAKPSQSPSVFPSVAPTPLDSAAPSPKPSTAMPSGQDSENPTLAPTIDPSFLDALEGLIELVRILSGIFGEKTATLPYRINCGSGEGVIIDGNVSFQEDEYYRGGQFVIEATPLNALYDSERRASRPSERPRDGDFRYSIPIPKDGNYTLSLYFAETQFFAPRQRLFNVRAYGTVFLNEFDEIWLQNYDIFERAGGGNIPVIETKTFVVLDRTLEIEFESVRDYAKVNAIEVVPAQ